MKVKVTSVFRDKFTHQLYSVGEVVEFEDEARVRDLENRKLAECVEEVKTLGEKKEEKISLFEKEFEKKVLVDALKAIGEKAAMNMKGETLMANVATLDKETIAKLKEALGIEV